MHASAGPAAGCWEGSPVALRAPYEPSQQRTKTERRSVTDVLIHGVTHVMIQNSFSSDNKCLACNGLQPLRKWFRLFFRELFGRAVTAAKSGRLQPLRP